MPEPIAICGRFYMASGAGVNVLPSSAYLGMGQTPTGFDHPKSSGPKPKRPIDTFAREVETA